MADPTARITQPGPPSSSPNADARSSGTVDSVAPSTDDIDSGWLEDDESRSDVRDVFRAGDSVRPPSIAPAATEAPPASAVQPVREPEPQGLSASPSVPPESEAVPPARASVAPRAESLSAMAASASSKVESVRPVADSAAPRAHSHSPAPVREFAISSPPKRGLSTPVLFGLLVAAAGALWLVFDRGATPPTQNDKAPVVAAEAAEPTSERASETAPTQRAAPAAPTAAAVNAPVTGNVETAPRAQASAVAEAKAPLAEPSASAAPSNSDANSTVSVGTKSVVVHLRPEDARLFYRGKSVGTSGVVVEIEPGKRRAFEVSAPGHVTRRLVIDGSTPEVRLGLRPDPNRAHP